MIDGPQHRFEPECQLELSSPPAQLSARVVRGGASESGAAAEGAPVHGDTTPLHGDDLVDYAVLTIANELDVARFATLLGAYAPTEAARALDDGALGASWDARPAAP